MGLFHSSTIASPAGTTITKDTAAGATVRTAVDSGGAKVLQFEIDNTLNSSASFLRIYSLNATVALHAVTVGSASKPHIVFKAPAGKKIVCTIATDDIVIDEKTKFACLTTGGTLGTTAPSSDVSVSITTG